jgi:hypothetical protein
MPTGYWGQASGRALEKGEERVVKRGPFPADPHNGLVMLLDSQTDNMIIGQPHQKIIECYTAIENGLFFICQLSELFTE